MLYWEPNNYLKFWSAPGFGAPIYENSTIDDSILWNRFGKTSMYGGAFSNSNNYNIIDEFKGIIHTVFHLENILNGAGLSKDLSKL